MEKKLINYACISLIMHGLPTKLLSSHHLVITMVHVKYLSQWVYGSPEKCKNSLKLINDACISLIMHDPNTILLS